MADLTGQTVASTYNLLLKIDTSGVDSTLRVVEGGTGTDSALWLSTGGVKSLGTFEATGATTLGGTLGVTGLITATGGVTGDVTGNCTGSSGSCTGNSITADALQTARNISVSGDVTGSVSFDGSANSDIVSTVSDNAVVTSKIAADAVTANEIAASAVGTSELADDSVTADKLAPNAIPAGIYMPFGGTSVPSGGWLECNGQSVSRTTYADLFAAIGTAYGNNDGSTFKVPNLAGRVAVGRDTGAARFDAIAETGGFKNDDATETTYEVAAMYIIKT